MKTNIDTCVICTRYKEKRERVGSGENVDVDMREKRQRVEAMDVDMRDKDLRREKLSEREIAERVERERQRLAEEPPQSAGQPHQYLSCLYRSTSI